MCQGVPECGRVCDHVRMCESTRGCVMVYNMTVCDCGGGGGCVRVCEDMWRCVMMCENP